MKILVVLSMCVAAAMSQMCGSATNICMPMQCCTDQGTDQPKDDRFKCMSLGDEGDACFQDYEANYQRNSYSFYCPCMMGLKCKANPDDDGPIFICQKAS